MIKKIASVLVFAVSMLYIFHGTSFRMLVKSVTSYSPLTLVLLMLAFALSYGLIALRWMFLSRSKITFAQSYEASVVCAGLNNIMPARLGDVSRLMFLKKVYGHPLYRTVAMTLLERLFDLLGLVSIGFIMVFYAPNIRSYIYPTLGIILVGCIVLFSLIRYPLTAVKLAKKVPIRKLKKSMVQSVIQLSRLRTSFFLQLYVLTMMIWAFYILVMYVFIYLTWDVHLSITTIATVFLISSLGVSLPSTPASIGVYEASVILAMSWFGIERESALSFALVYHVVMILCSVIAAFFVIYRKGFSFNTGLRKPSNSRTLAK